MTKLNQPNFEACHGCDYFEWSAYRPLLSYKQNVYEPPHDKTNQIACGPSKDSDQPEHLPSLIKSLHCPLEES